MYICIVQNMTYNQKNRLNELMELYCSESYLDEDQRAEFIELGNIIIKKKIKNNGGMCAKRMYYEIKKHNDYNI